MNTEKTSSKNPKKRWKAVVCTVLIVAAVLMFLFIVYTAIVLKQFLTVETVHKETEQSPDGKYELTLCTKAWLKLRNIEVYCQKEGGAVEKCIGDLHIGPNALILSKEYYRVNWMDDGKTVGVRYYAGYPGERIEDPMTWQYEELTIPSSVINSPSRMTVILIAAFSGVVIVGIIVCVVILLVKKKKARGNGAKTVRSSDQDVKNEEDGTPICNEK